jgi:hypothetical protein
MEKNNCFIPVLLFVALFMLPQCTKTDLITINGSVTLVESQTPGFITPITTQQGWLKPLEAGADTTITVKCDINGNGRIEQREITKGSTDEQGQYSLQAKFTKQQKVIVSFSSDGYSTITKVLNNLGTTPQVTLNVTLREMQALSYNGTAHQNTDASVKIEGLGSEVSGTAIRFNPATDYRYFPGDFSDSSGNLLVSTVFSQINLEPDNNGEVKNARLKMDVPQDTWTTIRDLVPGNGQIDVPLYYFDDDRGQWFRYSQDGWLEDSKNQKIPETSLGAIQNKTFAGVLYAVGDVNHFSTWNCDWPVDTQTTVEGTVYDPPPDTEKPSLGCFVQAIGITYTGVSETTTDDDGHFTLKVMRSEGPDEDVDGDGSKGETHRVKIRVICGGSICDLQEVDTPLDMNQAIDLGKLMRTEQCEVKPIMCTIHGVVTKGAEPLAGAVVTGTDENLPSELFDEMCFGSQANPAMPCTFTAQSDENGQFTLAIPTLDYIHLSAMFSKEGNEFFTGETYLTECPTNTITIPISYVFYFVMPGFDPASSLITWTPDIEMNLLSVLSMVSATGSAVMPVMWMVQSESGFNSGVTYGVNPAPDAKVLLGPQELTPGLYNLVISGQGMHEDNIPYVASGQTVFTK